MNKDVTFDPFQMMNNQLKSKQRGDRMLSRVFISIILLFTLFNSPTLIFGEGKNPKETVTYVDVVVTRDFALNAHDDIAKKVNYYGSWSKKGILYKSDKADLKAYLRHEHGNSTILIEWKKSRLKISLKDHADIKWRPKTSCFIYSLFDSTSGGDFGTQSLHYVCLSYVNDKIEMEDTEISHDQISTDLGWSHDGKYYAYSAASSLRIKNFETGKVWATKLILVKTKTETVEIPEETYMQLCGFIWLDGDKKLLFVWKNHPFDDAPAGAGVINIKQFKLD